MIASGVFRCTLTTTQKRWEFPPDRFVEYEPRDEQWARPLGFGREVEVPVKVTIPRVVVRGVKYDADGKPKVEMTALPEPTWYSAEWSP